KFSVIRFGNFWNSSGSFIEYLFSLGQNKQHTINITDFRMTRFFLTLQQAAEHIIYALKTMRGQEIFSPKMMSRKIVTITKSMHPNAILNETGIRPGEKLHEDLIVKAHARQTYETDRWFITYPHDCTVECIGKQCDENFEYNSLTALYSNKDNEILNSAEFLNYKLGFLEANPNANDEKILLNFKKTFNEK
ncbi:MAG: polysaccharide biosynthesis protein, partial [Nitrosarchaeum sp.]